jgi:murein DD-endopeptidase MepM/ murein hydrolase activator NlpD
MVIRPVLDGHISSEYGPRNIIVKGKKYTFHCGIDIGASKENPYPDIVCPIEGILYVHGWSNSFGWRSWIKITQGEYKNLFLVLAHMSKLSSEIKINQVILPGTKLGIMGATGLTEQKHTHVGLRINPSAAEVPENCPNPILIRSTYPL